MSKRESKSAANPMARPAIISILLSIALVVLLAALGGVLMLNGVLPEALTKPWAVVSVFLAALIGPMPLLRTIGQKKLPAAYGVLGALLLVLLLTKWIVWPGEQFTNWWVLPAGFVGATLAGILCAKKPKRKKY